jgi:hypothetical protein
MAEGDSGAADDILAAIGNLDGWHPWGQWVIGAIYHPPRFSKGGLLLPDHGTTRATAGAQGFSTQMSHRLEGKAFLMIAHGPEAFPHRLKANWGDLPLPGTWFFAMARDGIEITLDFGGVRSERVEQRGWPCRAFLAENLMGPLPHAGCIV